MNYSVLMSVYLNDKAEWLEEAINSMLNQTVLCSQFVIVVDGKISIELEEIIDNFSQKYPGLFKIVPLEKNVGLGNALRIGILQCDYEIIARMDSDDYSVPTRIEKQLEILSVDPEIGIVGSNIFEFIEAVDKPVTRIKFPKEHNGIVNFSKKRCPFRHPAIVFKKSKVLEAGNYREYYLLEDYDIYLRMIMSGSQCYNIQEELTYVRINDAFYKRRGGLNYFKSLWRFKTEYFKKGYFSLFEYIVTTFPHLFVILMPNFFRDWFYKTFLRETIND